MRNIFSLRDALGFVVTLSAVVLLGQSRAWAQSPPFGPRFANPAAEEDNLGNDPFETHERSSTQNIASGADYNFITTGCDPACSNIGKLCKIYQFLSVGELKELVGTCKSFESNDTGCGCKPN